MTLTPLVCPSPAHQRPGDSLAAPAEAGQGVSSRPLKTSWLVIVTFPGKPPVQFRWYKLNDARRCMRDFRSANKELRECLGRHTFEGWVDA